MRRSTRWALAAVGIGGGLAMAHWASRDLEPPTSNSAAASVPTTDASAAQLAAPSILEHCGVRPLATSQVESLRWDPCGARDGCRALATPWSDAAAPIAYHPLADGAPGGRLWLSIAQVRDDGRNVFVVADADGEVRSALQWDRKGDTGARLSCYVVSNDLNEGRFVFQLRAQDAPAVAEAADRAAIGGEVGATPGVLRAFANPSHQADDSYRVGSRWLTRIGEGFELAAFEPGGAGAHIVHAPSEDPAGLPARDVTVRGEAVFFATVAPSESTLHLWTEGRGSTPIAGARVTGDVSAGNLGTDGIDLVWSEGAASERFVVTAPFTTDAAKVEPRRLGKQLAPRVVGEAWRVGCKRAAHSTGDRRIEVVDLETGSAKVMESSPGLVLAEPIGLTCTELFAAAYIGNPGEGESPRYTVLRLRLDGLVAVSSAGSTASAHEASNGPRPR